MNSIRELIKEDYEKLEIKVDNNYLDGIMKNPERVQAFKKILGIDDKEVRA